MVIPFFIFVISIKESGMNCILDKVDKVRGVTKSLEAGVIITWTCAPAFIKVALTTLFYRRQFHQKFLVVLFPLKTDIAFI
jgi:hypothetical protein